MARRKWATSHPEIREKRLLTTPSLACPCAPAYLLSWLSPFNYSAGPAYGMVPTTSMEDFTISVNNQIVPMCPQANMIYIFFK